MASSNQTANYALCQWLETDPVLCADFNADNAKIDAALKGLSTGVQNAAPVTGTYIGNGDIYGESSIIQTITLGFRPSAVLVITEDGTFYGGAPVGYGIGLRNVNSGNVKITSTGFTVGRGLNCLNVSNYPAYMRNPYRYIAFR